MTIAVYMLAAAGAIILIAAVISDLRHWRRTRTRQHPPTNHSQQS